MSSSTFPIMLKDPLQSIGMALSQACFVVVLVALSCKFRHFIHGGRIDAALLFICNRLTSTSESSFETWLTEHGRYIMWWHAPIIFGMLTYGGMLTAPSPSFYLVGTICLFPLYDCASTYGDLKFSILLFFHHVGAFVAYLHQPGEQPLQASRNTQFFAWAWAIHSLPFIQDKLLPIVGLPKVSGKKYLCMDVVRHLYGAVTVYCYYLYVNGEGQPGLGCNYQSGAATSLLFGRYLCNSNWKMIDWARRVEVPGVLLVTVAHAAGNDFRFAAAVLVSAAICILSTKVAYFMPVPEQYALTPEIEAFIKSAYGQKPEVEPKYPFPIEMIKAWWSGDASWSAKWPLHEAVILNDVDTVKRHLQKGVAADLAMKDWYDTTPAGFAAFLGHLDILIVLLLKGVDPYTAGSNESSTTVMQSLSTHAHAKLFADKLHELAMKASPPAGDGSILYRVVTVLKQF